MKKRYKKNHSGWMRRTSRIYLINANKSKVKELNKFLNLYQNAVNYCIIRFWSSSDLDENLSGKEITKSIQERFGVTARLSQCAAKQAKEIVRSENEKSKSKKKRRMPRFTNKTANLDSRFVQLKEFNGSFDMCLKFGSGVPRFIIPFNFTKHTNKFRDDGWELSNSIRLGHNINGLFIDLIFEKERPPLKKEGEVIGIDRGFNNMLGASDGQFIGSELKETIKKGGKGRNNILITKIISD